MNLAQQLAQQLTQHDKLELFVKIKKACYKIGKVLLLNNVKQKRCAMLGVRLEPELEQRLTALAKKTKRSKSYLAKEALRDYIDRLENQVQRRQETLDRWEAYEQTGNTVHHNMMTSWLSSWGDDKEKPCPTIK